MPTDPNANTDTKPAQPIFETVPIDEPVEEISMDSEHAAFVPEEIPDDITEDSSASIADIK